jgi:hypothetical protein
MTVAALKQKPILKTFHATVHVTRTEPWCIEAEAAEEARELAFCRRRLPVRHWRRVKYRSRARRGLSWRTTGTPAFRVRFAILTSSMKTWISGGRSGSYGTRK